ncbi:MAG: hypothetical protein IIY55_08410, partial [Blautia sp.]|nr:hypothetical protein [Blautia sp.]
EEVLKKLYKDLEERKDQAGLEEDGFSYMYAMTYTEEIDPLDDFGYTFVDLTGTGYPALAILRNDETPIVYDLFSQEDGNVKHIFSSAERDYFTLSGYEGTDFAAIHEHASGGADLTEDNMFVLDPLKNELNQQVSFLYDGRENAENPFAVSYYPFDTPENLTQEEWIQRMENFGQDRLFTLTAIASVEP